MEKLARLRDETTGRMGDEVIALLRAEVRRDQNNLSTQLLAQTLLLRGYDAANAMEMAMLLRQECPRFDPTIAMLMGKDALEEELGPFFGKMISSMLVDPSCQPILHAILFANEDDPVKETKLTCMTATMACDISSDLRSGLTFTAWEALGPPAIVTNQLAASHYYRVTGEPLLDTVQIPTKPWKR